MSLRSLTLLAAATGLLAVSLPGAGSALAQSKEQTASEKQNAAPDANLTPEEIAKRKKKLLELQKQQELQKQKSGDQAKPAGAPASAPVTATPKPDIAKKLLPAGPALTPAQGNGGAASDPAAAGPSADEIARRKAKLLDIEKQQQVLRQKLNEAQGAKPPVQPTGAGVVVVPAENGAGESPSAAGLSAEDSLKRKKKLLERQQQQKSPGATVLKPADPPADGPGKTAPATAATNPDLAKKLQPTGPALTTPPVAAAPVIADPNLLTKHPPQDGKPIDASVPATVPAVPAAAGAAKLPTLAAPAVLPKLGQDTVKLEDLKKDRKQHTEDNGKRTVIEEPGNRTIVSQGGTAVIVHNDAARFAAGGGTQKASRKPDGSTVTIAVRPDGGKVFNIVNADGRLERRYRRERDGRETDLIDNRRFLIGAIGVGIGAVVISAALDLPPPVIGIPRERYAVEYEHASRGDLDECFSAPPVVRLERRYSLEEVLYTHELRERMRHLDLSSVTFASGAWSVDPAEYPLLERVADALKRVIGRHPGEVFLVEGHTDAVGSDIDNLSLSDRRAEEVARVLSEVFAVPPENLVTQGYGEQYLKIQTPEAERANRRVVIRRITPLMTAGGGY